MAVKIERMIENKIHDTKALVDLWMTLESSAPSLVALVKAAYAMVEFNSFQDPEHHKKQALRQALAALPEEWKP